MLLWSLRNNWSNCKISLYHKRNQCYLHIHDTSCNTFAIIYLIRSRSLKSAKKLNSISNNYQEIITARWCPIHQLQWQLSARGHRLQTGRLRLAILLKLITRLDAGCKWEYNSWRWDIWGLSVCLLMSAIHFCVGFVGIYYLNTFCWR